MRTTLTATRLKEVLHYNPLTGVFTWRVSRGKVKVGDPAGTQQYGYTIIRINGVAYRAHRLAFLYMTGSWPHIEVDHRDRSKSNNRWKNLRPATKSQNACNRVSHNPGKLGVKHIDAHQKGFRVTVSRKYVGVYKTLAEAIIVRNEAVKKVQGKFASGVLS